MRGLNRAAVTASPTRVRPPPPPRGTDPETAALWQALSDAVFEIGTYQKSDLLQFRLTVRTLAVALGDGAMPATARARVLQAAGSMLAAFGLSPLARGRVRGAPPRSATERVLDAALEDEA